MTRDLHDVLRQTARHTPDRPAFSFVDVDADDGGSGPQRVSYGQLCNDLDAAIASPSCGRPGERVFIAAATDYASILAYLASLFNGAVPAFLSPLTPRQDAAIHAHELQTLLDRFQPQVLVQDGTARRLHDRPALPGDPGGGFLQFSSGTTGLRKAVFIPQARLQAQLQSLGAALAVSADDRIASWLPLYHDMGLIATLFLPLYHGASVAFIDAVAWSFRPDSLLRLVAQERSTLCWQPDFAFRHLCNHQRRQPGRAVAHDLSSLRRFISCSEPCRAASFDEFRTVFTPAGLQPHALQTCYAMAETVFAITQSRFSGDGAAPSVNGFLSSGTLIDGCELRVVDTADLPDLQGVGGDGHPGLGQIEVRTSFLFDHYLGQPPAPARHDGWHATGDLGCVRDGQLYVLGRVDDTLVINGKKIIAHQIEDHLGRQPGFKPGRVFCTRTADASALEVYYESAESADGAGSTDGGGHAASPLLDAAAQARLRQWVASSSAVSLAGLHRVAPGTLVKSSSGKIARSKTLHKLRALRAQVTPGAPATPTSPAAPAAPMARAATAATPC